MIYAETFLLISCWREEIHLPDEYFNRLLKGTFLGYTTIELKVWVLMINPNSVLTSDELIMLGYGGTHL